MSELPDVPFRLPSTDGRELDNVRDAARGGHLVAGGGFDRVPASFVEATTATLANR